MGCRFQIRDSSRGLGSLLSEGVLRHVVANEGDVTAEFLRQTYGKDRMKEAGFDKVNPMAAYV